MGARPAGAGDLGTRAVIGLTAVRCSHCRRELLHLGAMSAAGIGLVVWSSAGRRINWIACARCSTRGRIRSARLPHIQGLLALGTGGIIGGPGESKLAAGCSSECSNDFIFAIIGEGFGIIGGGLVVTVRRHRYRASRRRSRRRTRSGAPRGRDHDLLACRRSSTSAWWWRSSRSRGSRCPSSLPAGRRLIISFAAAVSSCRSRARPWNEATWNDAAVDRGGGDRGTHLPALAVARSLLAQRTGLRSTGGRPSRPRGPVVRAAAIAPAPADPALAAHVDLSVSTVLDPARLALSVPQATALLLRRRPRRFSRRGYVAIPLLVAAAPLRIPVCSGKATSSGTVRSAPWPACANDRGVLHRHLPRTWRRLGLRADRHAHPRHREIDRDEARQRFDLGRTTGWC